MAIRHSAAQSGELRIYCTLTALSSTLFAGVVSDVWLRHPSDQPVNTRVVSAQEVSRVVYSPRGLSASATNVFLLKRVFCATPIG